METVPDICWILNMLSTMPSVLDFQTYPYDTDVETERGEVIFPWLVLAYQCRKWDSNLDLVLKAVLLYLDSMLPLYTQPASLC